MDSGIAIVGLMSGYKSYSFQHMQDLWFESDDFMELMRINDSFQWGGFVHGAGRTSGK